MAAAQSLRALGLRIGELEPGPSGTIADVAGVGVGHVTVARDEPDPPAGRGLARTGVTAIVPAAPETLFSKPLAAGVAVLNGAGEMTGSLQVREWGLLETPVYLTATMAVGRIFDGAVAAALAADAAVGVEDVVIPVVAECDDSWLSDARAVQVEAADAGRALADAARAGAVARGAVGAGTGMTCFGYKGGIGTASRVVAALDVVVGVVVLANFGAVGELRVDGVPVGRLLGGAAPAPERPAPAAPARPAPERPALARPAPGRPAGSCIAVVATDAPLGPTQLERVARRAGLGLARTGSVAHHASGEIFLAFSTTARAPRGAARAETVPDADLDPVFAATVDATEEALLDALWSAASVTGREGRVAHALPHDDVLALLAAHHRLTR
jgi:D-aminopeptidase